jgi:hypothetical protein
MTTKAHAAMARLSLGFWAKPQPPTGWALVEAQVFEDARLEAERRFGGRGEVEQLVGLPWTGR